MRTAAVNGRPPPTSTVASATVPGTPPRDTRCVDERRERVLDAFIFIQTHPGRAARVAEEVRSVEGVAEAVVVSGPSDVIARLRVPDRNHLHGLLSDRLRAAEGILRVLPFLVVAASMQERS